LIAYHLFCKSLSLGRACQWALKTSQSWALENQPC
jgi:hypothetical protein